MVNDGLLLKRFTGDIEVCFDYSNASYTAEAEANLQLLHSSDGTNWVDVTVPGGPDTENDIICGTVTSFSFFGLVEPDPVLLLQELAVSVIVLNLKSGIENSLDAKLVAALKALEDVKTNNDVAAINSLKAFVNAVQAQSGGSISEADADDLVALAQSIIALLSST